MSVQEFIEMTEEKGGTAQAFQQGAILEYFQSFTGCNVGQSVSRGSVTRVESNFSALSGVCFGLTMVMIELGFDFDELEKYIFTAPGKGKVRGYQHLQSLVGEGVDHAGRQSKGGSRLALFNDQSKLIGRILLGKYNVGITLGAAPGAGLFCFGPLIFDKKGSAFKVTGQGTLGSHAVCIANQNDKLSFFDPNAGYAQFDGTGRNACTEFCLFMESHFDSFYRYGLSDEFLVTPMAPVTE